MLDIRKHSCQLDCKLYAVEIATLSLRKLPALRLMSAEAAPGAVLCPVLSPKTFMQRKNQQDGMTNSNEPPV